MRNLTKDVKKVIRKMNMFIWRDIDTHNVSIENEFTLSKESDLYEY